MTAVIKSATTDDSLEQSAAGCRLRRETFSLRAPPSLSACIARDIFSTYRECQINLTQTQLSLSSQLDPLASLTVTDGSLLNYIIRSNRRL